MFADHQIIDFQSFRASPRRRRFLAVLAPLLLVSLLGASPPELVRIRLPANQAATWFPAGTELRMMPFEQFESLVGSAIRTAGTGPAEHPARLVRARHQARWNSGLLLGRSELVVEPASRGPSLVPLEAWTPAIPAPPRGGAIVGALENGKTALWLESDSEASKKSGSVVVTLDWELRARPESNGRNFTLGLPGDETTSLTLDLPQDLLPVGPEGYREGPSPSTDPARRTWRFHGRLSLVDLHLRGVHETAYARNGSAIWVGGPTRIELGSARQRGPGLANWRADWSVRRSSRSEKQFTVALDPGLELINVSGPGVERFQAESEGTASRVKVVLSSGSLTSFQIRFDAHARIPTEGRWSVPAIRPIDAIWTGGSTTIVLDEYHVVQDVVERSGRRIPPGQEDASVSGLLTFEAESPHSVADLVFHKPRNEGSFLVRGRLFVGDSTPRLECELVGTGIQGSGASELVVDLPPTWVPNQVQLGGLDDSVSWHSTVNADGSTKLRVLLPTRDRPIDSQTMLVSATSSVPGGRGPLVLPRIRPANRVIVDEVWVAMVDKDMLLQPTVARGLAWIDPNRAGGFLNFPALTGRDFREALAWRWIADNVEARVDRERIEQEPRAAIQIRSRVEGDRKQLSLSGRIIVSTGAASLASLPIWIDQPAGEAAGWNFSDNVSGDSLLKRPIEESERFRLGLPKSGSSWVLPITQPRSGQVVIEFHLKLPWKSGGKVPLIMVPSRFLPRGTVLVEIPYKMRSWIETSGLSRLDPLIARRAMEGPEAEAERGTALPSSTTAERPYFVAHALSFTEPGGRLQLFTEELTPSGGSGIIRDACLSTVILPRGPFLNRLRLHVSAESRPPLEITMPPNTSLLRIRRDGTDVATTGAPSRISIPIQPSGQGQRYRTIDLDYEVSTAAVGIGGRMRPVLPEISLSCLSFCWDVIAPPSWRGVQSSPDLITNDPDQDPAWPFGCLGLPELSWTGRGTDAQAIPQATLRWLDERLANTLSEELTFAEWFSRWDSGTTPVVVDRLLVNDAGYGPRSRCVPIRVDTKGQPVSVRTLQQYGLALVPLDSALLITTLAEASKIERDEPWKTAIREALLWGSDRSNRFQTVARWRGEISPREHAAADSPERVRALPGWTVWRFSGSNWPHETSYVRLIDEQTWNIFGWMVGVLVLLVVIPLGRLSPRWAIAGPVSLMIGFVLLAGVLPAWFESLTAGGFVSSLGILLVRLGQQVRSFRGRFRTVPRPTSGLMSRFPRTGSRVAVILLIVLSSSTDRAVAWRDREEPILVLIPYEGVFDPSVPPKQVILRLVDIERLQSSAQPAAPKPGPSIRAIGATHVISEMIDREIVVASDLVLFVQGSGSISWKFPVSGARDIVATLNDTPVPVFIEDGGQRASVTVPGGGTSSLKIRRTLSLVRDGQAETLDLGVNPIPSAHIILEKSALGRPVAALNVRGGISRREDQSIAARLGPTDRIQLRWSEAKAPAGTSSQSGGTVESVVLWDIEPSGDRVRARFTYNAPRPTSILKIAIEPGLIPRSIQVPGTVDAAWGGTDREPVWVAHIDPPLQNGSNISLDLWRPIRGGAALKEPGTPTPAPGPSGQSIRRFPRVEPVDVERYSGFLGVRRPGHWFGRLEPTPGAEPLSDESFVKTWGPLPDDALTLSGTTRFTRNDTLVFQTGPTPSRIRVRPSVQVQFDAGRLELELDAEITELSGILTQIQIQIPELLTILNVESDGLTDWSLSNSRDLRLRYDRVVPRSKRRVKLSGWMPVLDKDPLRVGLQRRRVPTPWFFWPGVEMVPGQLTLTSSSKIETHDAPGLVEVSSDSSANPTATDPRFRQTYRVDDPAHLGELRWNSTPPRVQVSLESQMTIHPDSAEWVVVLRYDAFGGALDALHLKVLTPWAARAQIQLTGNDYQLTSESRGNTTFWTINPERPIWGSQRLVLRSAIPLIPGQEIQHPEITPLGRGAVDTYLGIVDATGGSVTMEGSAGLPLVSYSNRFQAEEFGHYVGVPVRAFHVERESWSLKVQVPRTSEQSLGNKDESARVISSDIEVTMTSGRPLLGRAIYQTEARTGRFLVVELPSDVALLWASVDYNPVAPLRSNSGKWLIPLIDQTSKRVGVIWSGPLSSREPGDSGRTLALPQAGVGRVSTLVTLHVPAGTIVKSSIDGLELSTPDRLELERADRNAEQISDFLTRMDRSSGRDRERLASLLISHEMALRSAERSSKWNPKGGDRFRKERLARDQDLIKSARNAVVEMIRATGLDAEIEAARSYLGQATTTTDRTLASVPATMIPDRIPSLGQPWSLAGLSPGLEEPPIKIECALDAASWHDSDDPRQARSLVLLGVLLILGLVSSSLARRPLSCLVTAAAILGLLAYSGGPVVLIASLTAMALGWWSSPR